MALTLEWAVQSFGLANKKIEQQKLHNIKTLYSIRAKVIEVIWRELKKYSTKNRILKI